jgi:hypothetical protein
VQGSGAWAIGIVDDQILLAAAQLAEVRHRSIEPGQSSEKQSPGLLSDHPLIQQARHHHGRLPQWQPEKRLQRQASLDRGVCEHSPPPAIASRLGKPPHLRIYNDPRPAGTALLSCQFVEWWAGRCSLLICLTHMIAVKPLFHGK